MHSLTQQGVLLAFDQVHTPRVYVTRSGDRLFDKRTSEELDERMVKALFLLSIYGRGGYAALRDTSVTIRTSIRETTDEGAVGPLALRSLHIKISAFSDNVYLINEEINIHQSTHPALFQLALLLGSGEGLPGGANGAGASGTLAARRAQAIIDSAGANADAFASAPHFDVQADSGLSVGSIRVRGIPVNGTILDSAWRELSVSAMFGCLMYMVNGDEQLLPYLEGEAGSDPLPDDPCLVRASIVTRPDESYVGRACVIGYTRAYPQGYDQGFREEEVINPSVLEYYLQGYPRHDAAGKATAQLLLTSQATVLDRVAACANAINLLSMRIFQQGLNGALSLVDEIRNVSARCCALSSKAFSFSIGCIFRLLRFKLGRTKLSALQQQLRADEDLSPLADDAEAVFGGGGDPTNLQAYRNSSKSSPRKNKRELEESQQTYEGGR